MCTLDADSSSSQSIPPDVQQLHEQHGFCGFATIPVLIGPVVMGLLTLAHTSSAMFRDPG